MYGEGVRRFYVGCAVRVDTWAAEIIIDLKQQVDYADIELYCTIPFPDHDERFTAGQKKRYRRILEQCAHKEVINRHYSPTAYKRLNYYLIDNAQCLIAVYDQDKSSRESRGLVQMVNYAIESSRKISYINPDTAEISE